MCVDYPGDVLIEEGFKWSIVVERSRTDVEGQWRAQPGGPKLTFETENQPFQGLPRLIKAKKGVEPVRAGIEFVTLAVLTALLVIPFGRVTLGRTSAPRLILNYQTPSAEFSLSKECPFNLKGSLGHMPGRTPHQDKEATKKAGPQLYAPFPNHVMHSPLSDPP